MEQPTEVILLFLSFMKKNFNEKYTTQSSLLHDVYDQR